MYVIDAREICVIICSYALGCCTIGYYLTRWRTGKDIRRLGSGSVGATNVGRILGAGGFAITFLFDFVKGAVVVAASRRLNLSQSVVTACIVAVTAGHIWPIQLKFQGGKGIATSLGAISIYNAEITLILLCLFAPCYLVRRRFVLSGMAACALAPICVVLLGFSPAEIITITLLSMLVLYSHRSNISEDVSNLRRMKDKPVRDSDLPDNGG